jgi:hypothetical protein
MAKFIHSEHKGFIDKISELAKDIDTQQNI